jgi:putative tricarboxylic transport membrane protein
MICAFMLLGFWLLLFSAPSALAKYPTKPINIVSPFSPGGGTDIMARHIQAIMGKEKIIDIPIVVQNKPGGSGAIGYDYVAGKKGSPYFLTTVTTQFYSNPIMKTQKADIDDFTIICQLAFDPTIVMVRADYEYQTIQELIEGAKKNPGKIVFGGTGSTGDKIFMNRLEAAFGVKFNFIPFQSGGEVTTALLGKHVDFIGNQLGESFAQIEAGQIKPIAIAAETRSAFLPDVPTMKEVGADIIQGPYRGIAAPANLPEEAVTYLREAFKKLDKSERWQKEYIQKLQLLHEYRNGPEFEKVLREKVIPEYTAMLKDLGIIK